RCLYSSVAAMHGSFLLDESLHRGRGNGEGSCSTSLYPVHEQGRPEARPPGDTNSGAALEDEKLLFLLLLLLLFALRRTAGGSGGHNHRLAALVGAGAGVNVTGFDVNIGLFTQLGEIGAGRGLEFLGVDGLANLVLNVFQGRNSGGAMAVDLQDDEALFGPNHIGELARFQGKSLVFKFLGKFAALEIAQAPALGRGGAAGVGLGQIFKLSAFAQLLQKRLGLGLSFGDFRGIFRQRLVGASFVFIRALNRRLDRLRGNHDLAQADLFRTFHFLLVRAVEILNFFLADMDFRPYLAADHLLFHYAGAYLLLEIFERNSLLFRFFLQRVHAGQIHLLAHLVEPLDDLSIASDTQLFAFFEKQLAVNQLAKDFFLPVRPLGLPVVRRLLLQFLLGGLLGPLVVSARNDRGVYTSDDFVNDVGAQRCAGKQ